MAGYGVSDSVLGKDCVVSPAGTKGSDNYSPHYVDGDLAKEGFDLVIGVKISNEDQGLLDSIA